MDHERTAAELAAALDALQQESPTDTAWLSELEEETARWSKRHPHLDAPQRAFMDARAAQWPKTSSKETWRAVLASARALAVELRALGDAELPLCMGRTEWGTCRNPLDADGQCRSSIHSE